LNDTPVSEKDEKESSQNGKQGKRREKKGKAPGPNPAPGRKKRVGHKRLSNISIPIRKRKKSTKRKPRKRQKRKGERKGGNTSAKIDPL